MIEIRTLLLFGWFARITFIPAALLIGLWFLIQLFSQVGAVADVQTVAASLMRLTLAASSLERLPHDSLRVSGASMIRILSHVTQH